MNASRPGPQSAADPLQIVLIVLIWTHIWRIQDVFPALGTIKFPMLMQACALGLYALDRDPRRILASTWSPIFRNLLLLLGVMIMGVPLGLYPGRSFTFVTKDFAPTLAFLALVVASTRDYADVLRYLVWTWFGGLMYNLYVHLNISVGTGGRLGNLVYYDANDLGLLIVCVIPLALYLWRYDRGIVRLTTLAGIGLLVLMLMKTGSRGALIGFGAVMTFILLRFSAVPARTRIMAVVGAVGLLVAVGNEAYWTSMKTLLNPKADYNWSGQSEEGRMEVWKRGIGYAVTYPVAGVGPRNFPIAEGMYSDVGRAYAQEGRGFKWSAPHNSFVEVGAETGLVGFGLFMSCLVMAWRRLAVVARLRHHERPEVARYGALAQALQGVLIGSCASGFFVGAAYVSFLYLSYGLVLATLKVLPSTAEERVEEPTPSLQGVLRMRGGLAIAGR